MAASFASISDNLISRLRYYSKNKSFYLKVLIIGGIPVKERYTLKLKSGHKVKIRTGETYEVNYDDISLAFQEHSRAVNQRVHTHIWIEAIDDSETTSDIFNYVLWEIAIYPRRTIAQALVIGWELDEEEKEFEGPYVFYELIVERKFSQTLIDDIKVWSLEIYDVVTGYVAMRSLFGDKVEF